MEGRNLSPSTSRGATINELNEVVKMSSYGVGEIAKSVKDAGTGRVKPKIGPSKHGVPKPQTARDRARLDAGRQALRQLLEKRKEKKSSRSSCASLIRLYLTILAALLMTGGLIVLLFLFPMTIDPALATINYKIDVEPAICLTLSSVRVNRSNENFWCSCTEGCTKDIFFCMQITVAYRKNFLNLSKELQGNFNQTAYYSKIGLKMPTFVDDIEVDKLPTTKSSDCERRDWVHNEKCWNHLNASLYVNVKGCGYPPNVNCSIFTGNYNKTGRRFLCYYSKLDPSIVITEYDPKKPWEDLSQSLGWTLGAQAIGAFMIFILNFHFKEIWQTIIKKSRRTK